MRAACCFQLNLEGQGGTDAAICFCVWLEGGPGRKLWPGVGSRDAYKFGLWKYWRALAVPVQPLSLVPTAAYGWQNYGAGCADERLPVGPADAPVCSIATARHAG